MTHTKAKLFGTRALHIRLFYFRIDLVSLNNEVTDQQHLNDCAQSCQYINNIDDSDTKGLSQVFLHLKVS